MTRVAITHDENVERAIDGALRHFDLSPLVTGRHVAIKPNDTWADPSDVTAVTQPDGLRALIRALKPLRPARLTVTGGAGAAETDEVFRVAGLMDVIENEGVEFFDHNRPPFVDVDLRHGSQDAVKVNPRLREYDSVFVLSQLKVHETATVTLALKNIAMSYPAADYYGHPRGSYKHGHRFFEDLHAFIAGMAQAFPIAFAVTLGHPAMVASGPIGGHTVETGLVIASDDALAADVVGAKLLGFHVQGVRHLWEAAKLGLGNADLGSIEFPALELQEAIGIFTEKVYGRRLSFAHA